MPFSLLSVLAYVVQLILSCVQGVLPQGQNSCCEGLRASGFPPFLPDRPPWQTGPDWDSCMCLPGTDPPPTGERYLLSSVRVLEHWFLLLDVTETSGLCDLCVAKGKLEVKATSTACQGHFISGRLSSSFLNNALGCSSCYWNAASSRAGGIDNIIAFRNSMVPEYGK